jgi:hypothetical protein
MIEEQLQNVIEDLNICKKQCIVTDMNTTCSQLTGAQQFQSEIDIVFDVLVKNYEENAVDPTCSPACRRNNMRQMLAATFSVKSELVKLVEVNSSLLDLSDLSNTQLDTSSFEFGRPQMLCEEGKAFTKSHMCGTFSSLMLGSLL